MPTQLVTSVQPKQGGGERHGVGVRPCNNAFIASLPFTKTIGPGLKSRVLGIANSPVGKEHSPV